MKGDTVLLDMGPCTETEVTVTREPSTHSWKRTGALLTITLCFAAAAAIFFTIHYKTLHHAVEADDLRHTLRQISENARAAIHLGGEFNKTLEMLEWKQGKDQFHAGGGLKLDNNEIVVPMSGLYFVYSQASFRVSCHLDHVDVSHTVKLCSASYRNTEECKNKNYETILHSLRTACEKKVSHNAKAVDTWFGSVYMGAVFDLHRGDRLKTVMDKEFLPLLEDKPGKTFFGVFAL